MYQDEVDMMEIELLGRERAERLAAERAAAEANGRAELARLEATLLATEQKLDVAKKRLYFPAAKGYGCETSLRLCSGFLVCDGGATTLCRAHYD